MNIKGRTNPNLLNQLKAKDRDFEGQRYALSMFKQNSTAEYGSNKVFKAKRTKKK